MRSGFEEKALRFQCNKEALLLQEVTPEMLVGKLQPLTTSSSATIELFTASEEIKGLDYEGPLTIGDTAWWASMHSETGIYWLRDPPCGPLPSQVPWPSFTNSSVGNSTLLQTQRVKIEAVETPFEAAARAGAPCSSRPPVVEAQRAVDTSVDRAAADAEDAKRRFPQALNQNQKKRSKPAGGGHPAAAVADAEDAPAEIAVAAGAKQRSAKALNQNEKKRSKPAEGGHPHDLQLEGDYVVCRIWFHQGQEEKRVSLQIGCVQQHLSPSRASVRFVAPLQKPQSVFGLCSNGWRAFFVWNDWLSLKSHGRVLGFSTFFGLGEKAV